MGLLQPRDGVLRPPGSRAGMGRASAALSLLLLLVCGAFSCVGLGLLPSRSEGCQATGTANQGVAGASVWYPTGKSSTRESAKRLQAQGPGETPGASRESQANTIREGFSTKHDRDQRPSLHSGPARAPVGSHSSGGRDMQKESRSNMPSMQGCRKQSKAQGPVANTACGHDERPDTHIGKDH